MTDLNGHDEPIREYNILVAEIYSSSYLCTLYKVLKKQHRVSEPSLLTVLQATTKVSDMIALKCLMGGR